MDVLCTCAEGRQRETLCWRLSRFFTEPPRHQYVDETAVAADRRRVLVPSDAHRLVKPVYSVGTAMRPASGDVTFGYVAALENSVAGLIEMQPLVTRVEELETQHKSMIDELTQCYEVLHTRSTTIETLQKRLDVAHLDYGMLQEDKERRDAYHAETYQQMVKYRAMANQAVSDVEELEYRVEQLEHAALASRKRERELRKEGDRDCETIRRLRQRVDSLETKLMQTQFPDFIVMPRGVDSDWFLSAPVAK